VETEFVDCVFYQLPDPALAVINSTARLDNVQVGDVGRLLVVGTTSACHLVAPKCTCLTTKPSSRFRRRRPCMSFTRHA